MDLALLLAVLLPCLVGVCLIALAILVGRVGWQFRYNRFFAALYLLSGIKSIGEGLFTPVDANGTKVPLAVLIHQASPLFPDVYAWFFIIATCAAFTLPLLLLFVLNFPRPAAWVVKAQRRQLLLLLPAPFVAGLFIFSGLNWSQDDQHALNAVFNHVATALNLVCLYILLRTSRSAQPIERKQANAILLGFLPGFAVTLLITFVGDAAFLPGAGISAAATVDFLQNGLLLYVSPVFELAAAALVAFSILKYRILNFELQVKGGFRYALLTVVIAAIAFGVETYVSNFVLQNQVFSFLGAGGSAALAGVTGIVLFKPMHTLTGKLTNKLFPDAVKPKEDYTASRGAEIYRAQATHVLRDGDVTDREMAFLRTLREQLGIAEPEARRIEEEVERSLKVDSPLTGLAPVGGGNPGV